LTGFVRASFIGFMKAYHATGDSTNFPVPCNMTHGPSELLCAQAAYDTGNESLLRVFECRQHLKPVL
jgi:hypothetical protein